MTVGGGWWPLGRPVYVVVSVGTGDRATSRRPVDAMGVLLFVCSCGLLFLVETLADRLVRASFSWLSCVAAVGLSVSLYLCVGALHSERLSQPGIVVFDECCDRPRSVYCNN